MRLAQLKPGDVELTGVPEAKTGDFDDDAERRLAPPPAHDPIPAPGTLMEHVYVLKRELRLSGGVGLVVGEACAMLGIDEPTLPLEAQAAKVACGRRVRMSCGCLAVIVRERTERVEKSDARERERTGGGEKE